MRHSEITLVCEKGFYIDPNLVKPIGIHNKSYCWGVFIDNNAGSHKDLIISPFPYSSWAGIVRLQIRIDNTNSEAGQIHALNILDKNKANVLAMQTMHAGYSHDLMDIIIEIPGARELSKIPAPIKGNSEVAKLLGDIYNTHIRNKMDAIEEKLKCSSNICLYNEGRDIIRGTFSPETAASEFEKYCINNIRWEWLHILAMHAFHGPERLRFQYNKIDNDGLISLDMHDSYTTIGDMFKRFGKKNTAPFLAITGFNLSQHHLRLRAISNKAGAVYTFKTECRIKIHEDSKQQVSALGSRGLSHIVMAELKKIKNFKILSSSVEGLQRQDSKNETCSLYINAVSSNLSKKRRNNIEHSIKKAFKEKIKKDEQKADPENSNACSQYSEVRLEAYKRQPYKLFLSFRQEMMTDEVKSFLKSFLRGYGFEFITTQVTSNITANVLKTMQSCDACLQIYTLSQEENKLFDNHSPHRFVPDDAWLLFEFGVAKQLNIPVRRMIDVTNISKELWEKHLRIDKDALLFEFEKDMLPAAKDKPFVKQLNVVVQDLIATLNAYHRGH